MIRIVHGLYPVRCGFELSPFFSVEGTRYSAVRGPSNLRPCSESSREPSAPYVCLFLFNDPRLRISRNRIPCKRVCNHAFAFSPHLALLPACCLCKTCRAACHVPINCVGGVEQGMSNVLSMRPCCARNVPSRRRVLI
eukprot:6176332-Pleurochrysis_carterae.AAC.3